MQKVVMWISLFALIFIHTADMELTKFYIGNQWQNESFPPMSYSIKHFGINLSVWGSRIIMYTYFMLTLLNQHKRGWFYFLILITILYWVSMIGWVFTLGLCSWPFPRCLQSYC